MFKFFKILHVFLSVIFSCTLCSCDWFTSPNTTTIPQPIWVSSITTGESIGGLFPPTVLEKSIITLGSQNKTSVLYSFEKLSGKKQWEWKDFSTKGNVIIKRVHQYRNILVLLDGRKLYAINTDTGKTVWVSEVSDYTVPWISGFGQYFYYGLENAFLIGNSLTGQQENVSFSLAGTLFIPPISYIQPETKDTLLLATGTNLIKDSLGRDLYKTYIVAYNRNKNSLLYQLMALEGNSGSDLGFPTAGLSVILGTRVYTDIGRSIQCNDILTGKLVWRRKFLGSFYFSSIIAADNKIFGNSDDEGIMYALNPDTGDIIWQEQTSSASGDMLYMNGVIYIVGLGDGKLHAIDAQTGKHIWKFRSPDYESSNTNSSFEDAVTGDGQYVYVRSRLNLYCFKAAK